MLIAPISCRLRQEFAAKNPDSPEQLLNFYLQESPQAPKVLLGKLDPRFCSKDTAGQEVWSFDVTSLAGKHTIKINYSFAAAGENIQTSIDQNNYLIPVPHPVPNEELMKACVKENQGQSEWILSSPQTLAGIRDVLQKVAPHCEFDRPENGSWHCKLQEIDARAAQTRLSAFRQMMVSRWSRHPYLLTRRLAVSLQLADALTDSQAEKKLDNFCRLIDHSLPEELPLALRTQGWQKAVCKEKTAARMDAARLGLKDAETEINTLKQEFESTSRLGTLAVRIPVAEIPSRDFWITLNPLQSLHEENDAPFEQLDLCWHPFYVENSSFKITAAKLQLLNTETSDYCRQTVAQNTNPDKIGKNYILSSITSESEFPITNGQSKLLRLPEGDYRYTLQEHSEEEPWEAPPTSETSTGVIEWKSQRPRSVINTWETKEPG